MITLEVAICNQRRSYVAKFATEQQAISFIERKSSTHAFYEMDVPDSAAALLEVLYPTCPHGLSASNCYGPQHYYFDQEEQARGMRNGW